jgi:hypothetical protein
MGRTGSAWKFGGEGEREWSGGRGEKCPKQCMHKRINELKKLMRMKLSTINFSCSLKIHF